MAKAASTTRISFELGIIAVGEGWQSDDRSKYRISILRYTKNKNLISPPQIFKKLDSWRGQEGEIDRRQDTHHALPASKFALQALSMTWSGAASKVHLATAV
jgi:hypothetical protein